MATIPYQIPVANPASGQMAPPIFSARVGSHVNDGDFTLLTSGALVTAGVNPSGGLVGIAQHDSNATYDQVTTGLQAVFGASQENTALFPGTPGELLVATLGANIVVKMSLPATTGWITGGTNQAKLGTQVGLNIDGTTGFFYADDQASNKLGEIVGKVTGPGFGAAGDTGAVVYVSFFAASLAVQTGH